VYGPSPSDCARQTNRLISCAFRQQRSAVGCGVSIMPRLVPLNPGIPATPDASRKFPSGLAAAPRDLTGSIISPGMPVDLGCKLVSVQEHELIFLAPGKAVMSRTSL
jgi:hypothetical protein